MKSIKEEIQDSLEGAVRVLFSAPVASSKYRKVEALLRNIKGKELYHFSCYTEKQVFQNNVEPRALCDAIAQYFPEGFRQLHIYTEDMEYSFKITKKGRFLKHVGKRPKDMKVITTKENQQGQNRKKHYLLQEGTVIAPLVDMGVFTKEGKVVASMYDKFKQINRFVELVDDILKDETKQTLNIIDFGCGKSYLTFILYYYLVEIKGRAVNIIGLDLKEDIIEKCNLAAKKYGYENLRFELGDINGYETDMQVDMVVTLHACDTATDYALQNAVNWNAKYILSVPCCQHEVNAQLQKTVMPALMRHGIIKERVAALATDAIRADMLTYRGYKTQVLEFVDLAHSPKNLLIRAVKAGIPKQKRNQAKQEVMEICEQLQIKPTICNLLDTD
ncbi:MAG: class I SAM-dependent methyltransferase [Wujia sp.]